MISVDVDHGLIVLKDRGRGLAVPMNRDDVAALIRELARAYQLSGDISDPDSVELREIVERWYALRGMSGPVINVRVLIGEQDG